MKVYGYVRDKDGNYNDRKEKVLQFSKTVNLPIDKMICETAYDNYGDMIKIRELFENEETFILIVSDTSDLFEDEYAKMIFLKQMDEKNIFLIDSGYPNFDYKMLIEKYRKETPFSYLTNTIVSGLEIYARRAEMYDGGDSVYNDMRQRLEEWKSALDDTCNDI